MHVSVILREIWFSLKEFFKACYYTTVGFFLFSRHQKNLEEQRRKADIHHHFKEERNKKNMRWVLKERARLRRLLSHSAIPKKRKNDWAVFNYISGVLLTVHPKNTVEQVVQTFYQYLHPYFLLYWCAYKDLKKILGKERFNEAVVEEFRRKWADVPDVYARAEQIMEVHKKTTKELRDKERRARVRRTETEEKVDLELLKVDEAVLEKRAQEAQEALDAFKGKHREEKKRVQGMKEHLKQTGGRYGEGDDS